MEKEEGCMEFSNQRAQGGADQLCNHQTFNKGVCHTEASEYHISVVP